MARLTQRRDRRFGSRVTPSVANFILIHFPRTAGKTAAEADKVLTARGLILRQVGAYGLPDALRMTVGIEEANRLVVATLAEFMRQDPTSWLSLRSPRREARRRRDCCSSAWR